MIAREETLRDLMTRSQAGDKQAYAVLLEQTSKWLARFFAVFAITLKHMRMPGTYCLRSTASFARTKLLSLTSAR